MTEMLETSKDNVYIKISIDDDVNNNSNQVYIDKEFIESIPNAESGACRLGLNPTTFSTIFYCILLYFDFLLDY